MSERSGVFLVDDHQVLIEGLERLIEGTGDLFVCGTAGTCHEARERIPRAAPKVLVVDISLPDDSGLSLISEMRYEMPGVPMLVLSMHDEAFYAPRAIAAGARGFISKNTSSEDVITAIRHVLDGHIHVSPELATDIIESAFTGSPVHKQEEDQPAATGGGIPSTSQLSPRELEVLELIGRGFAAKEIAGHLGISVKTVETHRQRTRTKLGIDTTSQLVVFAANWVSRRGAS